MNLHILSTLVLSEILLQLYPSQHSLSVSQVSLNVLHGVVVGLSVGCGVVGDRVGCVVASSFVGAFVGGLVVGSGVSAVPDFPHGGGILLIMKSYIAFA